MPVFPLLPPAIRLRPAFVLLVLLSAATSGPAADRPDQDEARVIHSILDRWVDACGGAKTLRRRETVEYHLQVSVNPARPALEMTAVARAGGPYRQTITLPGPLTLVEAYDGRTGWVQSDAVGFGLLSRAEAERTARENDPRLPLEVLQRYHDLRLLPEDYPAGGPLRGIELTDAAGLKETWFFSRSSGQRVRLERREAANTVVLEFMDFRPTEQGIEPSRMRRTQNGQQTNIEIVSVHYNRRVDQDSFAPPEKLLRDYRESERILQHYVQACGGDAIGRIRTAVTKATVEISSAGMKYPATMTQKLPNLVLNENEIPGMGAFLQGFDGQTGWAWAEMQGYRELKGAELLQLLSSADLHSALHLRSKLPLRRLLGERVIGGRRALGLVLGTVQGSAGSHYFDAETGQLLQVESNITAGPQGQLKVTVDFSDFRTVDGIVLPFVTVMTNPAMRIVTTILSVQ
ncbi:MAG: hypothetical protein ACHQ5A_07200, partial [Opitutales bacterium]